MTNPKTKPKKLIRKLKRSNERLWAAIRVLQHRVDENQSSAIYSTESVRIELRDAAKNGTAWRETLERALAELALDFSRLRGRVEALEKGKSEP